MKSTSSALEFVDAGHFVQEWGEEVAPAAIAALHH